MPTNYVQGPDLHHYRKDLHLSRKQKPASQSAKKMPPQELIGCQDQLLINKAILEEVRSKYRNLSTTWIY